MNNDLSRAINFLVFGLPLLIVGCGAPQPSGGQGNSSIAPVPYCSSVLSHANPVTLTGTGAYQYRTDGNGAVAAAKPIRYAEVRVTTSNGTIVQCGQTAANGTFAVNVPQGSSALTVTIASRGDNSFVKAYVLTNPTNNTFHGISTTTVPDSSKNIGSLVAPATGSLEGGAFNIFDQIVESNNFLRTKTTNCSASFTGCVPFSVAPLVTVYWSRGVDPGTYFGIGALSFYLSGQRKLYILGGNRANGDIDSSDTDHFDNTIIIHEYGHFIEDVYSVSNSPGGPHSGNTILDPRLAWGEAWANYFQAEVLGLSRYRDTFGTPLGTPGVFFNENLESGSLDSVSGTNEGNFREFAITRALVDYTDTNNEGASVDQLTASFAEFWTAFASPTVGMANTSRHFRSVGLLYELQNALAGKTNWSEIQAAEKQRNTKTDYGNTLTLGGGCGTTAIQAANISGSQPENGSVANSNQFASNDFYQYTHAGGNFTLALSYTTTAGNPADVDVYLYKNDYVFGSLDSVVGSSTDTIILGQGSDTESFTVSNLPAGVYMININVNTKVRIGSTANYSFTINGQNACPD